MQCFQNLVAVEHKTARYPFSQVAAFDLNLHYLGAGECGANLFFDAFSGGFANQGAVVAADITDDRLIKTIAADADRVGVDDAVQRNNSDLRGAAANIQHHGTACFINGQAGANGSGHWLVNQIDLTRTRATGRLFDSASLNLG